MMLTKIRPSMTYPRSRSPGLLRRFAGRNRSKKWKRVVICRPGNNGPSPGEAGSNTAVSSRPMAAPGSPCPESFVDNCTGDSLTAYRHTWPEPQGAHAYAAREIDALPITTSCCGSSSTMSSCSFFAYSVRDGRGLALPQQPGRLNSGRCTG